MLILLKAEECNRTRDLLLLVLARLMYYYLAHYLLADFECVDVRIVTFKKFLQRLVKASSSSSCEFFWILTNITIPARYMSEKCRRGLLISSEISTIEYTSGTCRL